jgi:hypothetical protein
MKPNRLALIKSLVYFNGWDKNETLQNFYYKPPLNLTSLIYSYQDYHKWPRSKWKISDHYWKEWDNGLLSLEITWDYNANSQGFLIVVLPYLKKKIPYIV